MNGRLGCLPLLLFLALVVLLPFMFAQAMLLALAKLRLSPDVAIMVILGILFGSAVNIPVARIARHEDVTTHPYPLFGLFDLLPRLQRVQRETIIAVNLGGCVIPGLLALYESIRLLMVSWRYVFSLGLAVAISTAACYSLARPVRGVGIAMPALVPPLVAAAAALLLAPGQAPPVAFVAGVMGPLLGADILHLRDVPHIATGLASIGGAGTFDGIVLSGILAAYLA